VCLEVPLDFVMSRVPSLSSPFLLGFDAFEPAFGQVSRTASDGYPPYNIERMAPTVDSPERLRITLAVAGFTQDGLEILIEEGQLVIRGRQGSGPERHFLHRGIAARQFQRVFLLAEGMQVDGANLENGLLAIDLIRPEPERVMKRIDVTVRD
jgi:HSP20 family molecular chaperone IbpA